MCCTDCYEARKVTDDEFGDKKFQHQNLNRIDEAVRDVSMTYGLAAVQSFKASELFPTQASLDAHEKANGNHHDLSLSSFNKIKYEQSTLHCQVLQHRILC